MLKKVVLTTLFAVVLMVAVCGCKHHEVESQKLVNGMTAKTNYTELKNYKVELKLVSSPKVEAGEKAVLTYNLYNVGANPIRIEDWYRREASNLDLKCQVWLPDQSLPDEDRWIPVGEVPTKQALRYPVTLNPGNFLTIKVELPFLRSVVVSPGHERRYFIKSSLRLQSIKAEHLDSLFVYPHGTLKK